MTIQEKINLAKENERISTQKILKDISDTEAEIRQMKEEAEHLEKTPLHMREAKWDHMRAQSRRTGIEGRKKFIEELKAILEVRNGAIEEEFLNE